MSTVISVENLWKQYRLGTISHQTLTRDLQSWWARLRGKEDPNRRIDQVNSLSVNGSRLSEKQSTNNQEQITNNSDLSDRFWALKDVSFEVKQGEVLGIIGRNGAGKSTLLKIMSRVTTPTKGEIKIKGRVASLLEVGTGFHPELTGRENIFLNGAILGMDKTEIRKKFDEIVGFAEIGKFVDTPVKRYSSGMYVRLAFAVAAHLEPDILVVDEVLAVGDVAFQKKCLGKMHDVAGEGRTVLFVSHNMAAVNQICTRAILLRDGKNTASGLPDEIIQQYIASDIGSEEHYERTDDAASAIFYRRIHLAGPDDAGGPFDVKKPITVALEVVARESLQNLNFAVRIDNGFDVPVFTTTSTDSSEDLIDRKEAGVYRLQFLVPGLFLMPGDYFLTASIFIMNGPMFDLCEKVIKFRVLETGTVFARYGNIHNKIGQVICNIPWSETCLEQISKNNGVGL